jgi:Fe-S cluster assembly iron-binding protein IscA
MSAPEDGGAVAVIPGHARFTVTPAALEMIGVFGGSLHCFQGTGGCRSQGLYFSRTRPKKYLECTFEPAAGHAMTVTVSHELAPRLDGAVLDFGRHNRMQRFVWAALPAVKGPQCTCLRSMGKPAGKRSPCLDDAGVGITDL